MYRLGSLGRKFSNVPLSREELAKYGILNRVVHRNLKPAQYYEISITRTPANYNTMPSMLTSTGAYAAYSGEKCGRSPQDKRIVEPDTKEEDQKIWWGNVNKKMSRDTYDRVL